MTNVSVTNIFRGFCHLLSITTCFELELQNTTDLITATWGLLNQLNGMGLLSSGYWILQTGVSTEKQLFANHKVTFQSSTVKWRYPLMLVDRLIFELLTLDQDGISGTDPSIGYNSKYQDCLLVVRWIWIFCKVPFWS